MLENSQSNPKAHTSFNWTFEKAFVMILIGTLIGAFLGSMLWLLLPGPRANRSELWTILGFGAAFGGWVSFFSCVSFSLIHRIRENVRRSALRMMLTFAILSGIAGAPVFFFFGDASDGGRPRNRSRSLWRSYWRDTRNMPVFCNVSAKGKRDDKIGKEAWLEHVFGEKRSVRSRKSSWFFDPRSELPA